MSYQVLARKWRPKGFEEVVGQDHVVQALSNAIQQGRLHHAYMFTGTRGVGKTTIARILAKCLNCESGMTVSPCEQCEACLAVNQGRFVDLIEVDGASRTKVEDTRELLDNVQYAPVQGRIKIYLIDEVHMLSNHSFNALLKTLEEPPEHVKFLLATTDPQKVPVTILSRCLQFTLKQLTPELIAGHLEKVLSAEAVQFEASALLSLAKAARGSARDALSLTDQAIAYGGGQVTQAQVQSMLGTVHQQALEQVLTALSSQDPATVLQIVDVLVRDGIDIQQLVQDLLGALHRLSLAKTVPAMLNQADEADQSWLRLAQSFSTEALQVYYQIALLGLRDLSWAPDMRAAVEMLLLRMMLFDLQADPMDDAHQVAPPDVSVQPAPNVPGTHDSMSVPNVQPLHENDMGEAPSSSTERSLVGQASDSVSVYHRPPVQPPSQTVGEFTPEPVEAESAVTDSHALEKGLLNDRGPEVESADIILGQSVEDVPQDQTIHQAVDQAPQVSCAKVLSAEADPAVPVDLAQWLNLIAQMQQGETALAGPALNLARNCVVAAHADGILQLVIAPTLKMLLTENAQQRLRDALMALHQAGIEQVKIQVGDQQGCTPAQWIKQQAALALENAHAALQADPFIEAIQNNFSATIVKDSVRPLLASPKDAENSSGEMGGMPEQGGRDRVADNTIGRAVDPLVSAGQKADNLNSLPA